MGKAGSVIAFLFVLIGVYHLGLSQSAKLAQTNLAPTPPMGWASWNYFFCDYNDQTIRNQADALVSTGMRDLGYKYVLIQECIAPGRDSQGRLIIDQTRFPNGMKSLVDYIHLRGLKAGVYTDVGPYTCYPDPRYQGSFNHEDQDAETFASWGFDFVEMDYCNRPPVHTGREIYERMATAIQKTGRPMVFYICSWGNESPWTWAYGKAQLWRTDEDISPDKNRVDWESVVNHFESNARHSVFSAPNSWNDPDMMEIGNTGLSLAEAKTHFAMWAISAAPLWVGNDLTNITDDIHKVFTNADIVAVDQDPLGAGASRIREDHRGLEVWSKPLGSQSSGVDAVMLLNLTDTSAEIGVRWSDLGLSGKAAVRDLWEQKDLGEVAGGYVTRVAPHGSALLKVTGEFSWTRGASYEAEWPGNLRRGEAMLLPCPECSQGYAVSLREKAPGTEASSIEFTHINAQRPGTYGMTIGYAHSGLDAKTVQVSVNEGRPVNVQLDQYVYGSKTVPVELKKGANSITLSYSGTGSLDIDRITISQ